MTSLPRVLVVEDDSAIRNLLVSALARQPLLVEAAPDGVTALANVERDPYEVLLVDLMMPRMDGFAFLEAVAGLGLPKRPMVIVMTAFDDRAWRQLDPSVVHVCIRKPFDLAIVVELIRDCAQSMSRAAYIAEDLSISGDITGGC